MVEKFEYADLDDVAVETSQMQTVFDNVLGMLGVKGRHEEPEVS